MQSADGIRQRGDRRARWMCGLLAGTAFVGADMPAAAQDATWLPSPPSNIFNSAANWTPATVPTGTAFFGTSNTTTLVFSAGTTTVGGWTFNAGASAYSFALGSGQILNFNGAGITSTAAAPPSPPPSTLNLTFSTPAPPATLRSPGTFQVRAELSVS
jgi:hypothetical protein